MRKLFVILFLLAMSVAALAQAQLSPRDQQRFDSYFARWQEYRRVNDRDQAVSMERRMLDVYAHYGIPDNTPFSRVASQGREEMRREEHPRWRERLANDDRMRFDELYSHWVEARDHGDQERAEHFGHRMRDIMERNGIPPEVRFDELASHRERGDHDRGDHDQDRDRD